MYLGKITFWYKLASSVALLTLIFCANTWAASTYYVDPNGDDNDEGSACSPFATIQKALDEANDGTPTDYAVVAINTGTHRTAPVYFNHDNVRLFFAPDVTVQAFSFDDPNGPSDPNDSDDPTSFAYPGACLFTAWDKNNIDIVGDDTTFLMHRAEYAPRPGPRIVIKLYGCRNVNISGVNCKDSGYDGIYMSGTSTQSYCENISITDVNCDNSYRHGITAISVDGLTIDNCVFQNSAADGINLEPGVNIPPSFKLKNIVIRNCEISSNGNSAIQIPLGKLSAESDDVDIVIEDCNLSGQVGVEDTGVFVGSYSSDGVGGQITFRNVVVEGNFNRGFRLENQSSGKINLRFENCTWRDTQPGTGNYPISIYNSNSEMTQPGGVEFVNCQVFDDIDRPAIDFERVGGPNELYDVHGDLYVTNPNRIGDLYDWHDATLYRVDLTLHDAFATANVNDADPKRLKNKLHRKKQVRSPFKSRKWQNKQWHKRQ